MNVLKRSVFKSQKCHLWGCRWSSGYWTPRWGEGGQGQWCQCPVGSEGPIWGADCEVVLPKLVHNNRPRFSLRRSKESWIWQQSPALPESGPGAERGVGGRGASGIALIHQDIVLRLREWVGGDTGEVGENASHRIAWRFVGCSP